MLRLTALLLVLALGSTEATPACDTDGKCTDSVAIAGCGKGNEAKATYSIQLCCPGSEGSAACNKKEQCGAQVHDLATIPDFNVTLKYGFELVEEKKSQGEDGGKKGKGKKSRVTKMRIVNDAGKTLLEEDSIPDDCRGSFSDASATLYKAASWKAINTTETKCKLDLKADETDKRRRVAKCLPSLLSIRCDEKSTAAAEEIAAQRKTGKAPKAPKVHESAFRG